MIKEIFCNRTLIKNLERRIEIPLLVLLMAFCALIYELLIGSLMVLYFGDVIFYFSLTIAFFILFMGLGAYLSKSLGSKSFPYLVFIEILICFLGLLSVPLISLVASITHQGSYIILTAFCLTLGIGILSGAEIPLLYEGYNSHSKKSLRLGSFLSFDYLGSLLGSIFFVFYLIPKLGFWGAGTFGVLLNTVVAFRVYSLSIKKLSPRLSSFVKGSLLGIISLSLGLQWGGKKLQTFFDWQFFKTTEQTEILESFQTHYQKVTLTLTPSKEILGESRLALFLNNYLQFDSNYQSETDPYHHAFVHPALVLAKDRKKVLILGGGDGLPAKEVLKYHDVEKIVNVDLDGELLKFTQSNPFMLKQSQSSFLNPKVELIVSDAFLWIRDSKEQFDVILVDFPEGVDVPLARSYSWEFLKDLGRRLNEGGTISFQMDFFNNPVYWSVVKTMVAAGYKVIPHHTMESNGVYGLAVLSINRINLSDYAERIKQFSFIHKELLVSPDMLEFYREESSVQKNIAPFKVNTYFNPRFLSYYREFYPWEISVGGRR